MILVTGGTGFLGANLLLHLLENEVNVRAIYRNVDKIKKTERLFEIFKKSHLFKKIEWLEADILDIPSLETAFQNIDYVYHCAGFISFNPNDEEKLRKINIEGTANIVNLSLDFNVKKICHVSSIAALGDLKPHENTISETTEWNPEKSHSDYAITKYGAEMEVWRAHQEGLKVVVVNPGVILGNDQMAQIWNEGSGEIFNYVKKENPFYTKGSTGFVAVLDVVKIMHQLMNSEIVGERFCIVAQNLTFQELNNAIADDLKVKKPTFHAKPWMTSLTWRLDLIKAKVFRKKRKLSREIHQSLHNTEVFSNEKIKQVLGFEFGDLFVIARHEAIS
jgi:dihydroflavonol-4-reductase